ncbi:leucine-rich repeat, cysteine-containing subtype protein [Tanacetum coccineum]|uniref:Leucine-rich repeat, cysteine-containing subtype protein n=1 Tax=Tanacetum coccineum TaxID=301880 RepID=A0ABQ4YFC0_9ASTR
MVIGVDGKPRNEALKKIDKIPAVEEFWCLLIDHQKSTCVSLIVVDLQECTGLYDKEIAVKFTSMRELQIHGLVVYGKDLETLATSRGKDLRVLKINKYCRGKWEEGLVYVAKYCNQLRTLSLEGVGINNEEHGKWLHELAIHNTVLESFHCSSNHSSLHGDIAMHGCQDFQATI